MEVETTRKRSATLCCRIDPEVKRMLYAAADPHNISRLLNMIVVDYFARLDERNQAAKSHNEVLALYGLTPKM